MEISKLLDQLLLVTLVNRGKVTYSLLKNGVCDIWCRMLAFSRDKGDLVIMQNLTVSNFNLSPSQESFNHYLYGADDLVFKIPTTLPLARVHTWTSPQLPKAGFGLVKGGSSIIKLILTQGVTPKI